MTRIIYDLGANRGQNIEYYLLKADRVVAVEANPELANIIRKQHSEAIAEGRLTVVNAVVTIERTGRVPFYIADHDYLSQLDPPTEPWNFTQVELDSINIIDLIDQHGEPWYIKIDLEFYDNKILTALFAYDIRPPFISSEIHNIQVLDLLYRAGGYRQFKYVVGGMVTENNPVTVRELSGATREYNCIAHSAGPMGEDIKGPWLTLNELNQHQGSGWTLGWYDIHATL